LVSQNERYLQVLSLLNSDITIYIRELLQQFTIMHPNGL